jgi:hypothetical protein
LAISRSAFEITPDKEEPHYNTDLILDLESAGSGWLRSPTSMRSEIRTLAQHLHRRSPGPFRFRSARRSAGISLSLNRAELPGRNMGPTARDLAAAPAAEFGRGSDASNPRYMLFYPARIISFVKPMVCSNSWRIAS